MPNAPRFFLFDQLPVLASSTAAREAIPEDVPPKRLVEKHCAAPGAEADIYRNSSTSVESDVAINISASHAANLSKRPVPTKGEQPSDNRSCLASSIVVKTSDEHIQRHVVQFLVGIPQKRFSIDTVLLTEWSPYFAAMKDASDTAQPSLRSMGPFHFPDLDEFAFALFVRWIHCYDLRGPHDFHSMNHYLELYVMAAKFQIEVLQNSVMDLIRQYYRRGNMTAPAFRLDFVYKHTNGPCLMREFLVTTAAYRALTEAEEHSDGISNSVKGSLANGGNLAQDYANSLCRLAKTGIEDVREGDPCRWHEHKMTPPCKPWSHSGALDS